MLNLIKENVLLPLAGRIGTMVATALIGYGVSSPLANQVAIGVTAFGLIVADLAVSWLNRKRIVNNLLNLLYGSK